MVLLRVLSGEKAGAEVVARRFPFRLGRAPAAELRLEAPGVWDQHAELRWPRRAGLELVACGEAFTAVNGERVRKAPLRNGDVIDLGGARVQFWLAPTRQKSLRWREALTWAGLVALTALEVFILRRLL